MKQNFVISTFLLFVLLIVVSNALVHHFLINDDYRQNIPLHGFKISKGQWLDVQLLDFEIATYRKGQVFGISISTSKLNTTDEENSIDCILTETGLYDENRASTILFVMDLKYKKAIVSPSLKWPNLKIVSNGTDIRRDIDMELKVVRYEPVIMSWAFSKGFMHYGLNFTLYFDDDDSLQKENFYYMYFHNCYQHVAAKNIGYSVTFAVTQGLNPGYSSCSSQYFPKKIFFVIFMCLFYLFN